jgi:hypothetical protein
VSSGLLGKEQALTGAGNLGSSYALGTWCAVPFGLTITASPFTSTLSMASSKIPFDGLHQTVVAACGGSLIGRIQQADFQDQLFRDRANRTGSMPMFPPDLLE